MKYTEAQQGRCLIIRLEDGDLIHESLEGLARDLNIKAASMIIIGGADQGSRLVVGPEKGRARPVVAMEHVLADVHEIAGVGTLFPDVSGQPRLHMHIACGRGTSTVTGCVRRGVKAWHIMEVVLFEIRETSAQRRHDPITGFDLLEP